jgi:hypothetical protein
MSTSNKSGSGGEASNSNIRHAGPPIKNQPPLSPEEEKKQEEKALADLKIPAIDSVDFTKLKSSQSEDASFAVRLKSNKEGVTSEQRIAHFKKILELCKKYDTKTYPGIEARMRNVFIGYVGYFNPVVIAEIKKSPV